MYVDNPVFKEILFEKQLKINRQVLE